MKKGDIREYLHLEPFDKELKKKFNDWCKDNRTSMAAEIEKFVKRKTKDYESKRNK